MKLPERSPVQPGLCVLSQQVNGETPKQKTEAVSNTRLPCTYSYITYYHPKKH